MRGLCDVCVRSIYNACCLNHEFEPMQFPKHFIKEIKNFIPVHC